MIYDYPAASPRIHGPWGYSRYQHYKEWLRDEFAFRCAYCLVREIWFPPPANVLFFGVDHIQPKSLVPELECTYDNLVYACNGCNQAKGSLVPWPDPRCDSYARHLVIREDGVAESLSHVGKRIIDVLLLNNRAYIEFRRSKIREHQEVSRTDGSAEGFRLRELFGYPTTLPDLENVHPAPMGNNRPDGVRNCHFVRRSFGRLPMSY